MNNMPFLVEQGCLDIWIDEVVPCLKDTATGELIDTVVFKIESRSYLKKFKKKDGWHINSFLKESRLRSFWRFTAMNGIEKNKRVPKFLEGEPLPIGYFDPPNPYVSAPTRKVELSALVTYARKNGKNCWELTKAGVKQFEPAR